MARNYDITGEVGGGIGPSFMRKKNQRQEKQSGSQTASEAIERAGRLHGAMKDKKDGKDAVTRLQEYAKAEGERERKKKAEAEAAKKKQKEGGVAPSKGFIERMRDYWFPSKESK